MLQQARIAYETRDRSPDPSVIDSSLVELSGMNGGTRLIWASPNPADDYDQSSRDLQLPSNLYPPNGSNSTDLPLMLDNTTNLSHFSSSYETHVFPHSQEAWNALTNIEMENPPSLFPALSDPFHRLDLATNLNQQPNDNDEIDWEQLLGQLGADL